MTDPRIEAAARSIWMDMQDAGKEIAFENASTVNRAIALSLARNALAAADAAAWREIATAPTDSSEVLVWDGDSVSIAGRMGKYWWSDAGYSIDNATHWQPVPKGPTP